ncbi:BglG family transcription antiterminator [Bacillus taeanensis]|uniref:Transcriptional antiterminator n=1 Tax=Bacillus taeanensis TaxID=273032 RepID=A0A366XWI5_9BACI|nr:BglG family transcription antiterminator [Bacillus taeanensis]RBW68504.1 transcriptional antiterminator [Bacillus taeanensis]
MLEKEGVQLNSRQQQILLLLLKSPFPVTLKEMSNEMAISGRTIQRELSGLDSFLESHDLVLTKKTGVGLSLNGEKYAKEKLLQYLSSNQSNKIFAPEERQYILKQLLLTLKEPTKLYSFSNKFRVTEATISNDLLKVEPWFDKHDIKLIRKPGFGVYIEGSEKSIRGAIVDLFYQHFSQEQLMEVLSTYSYSSSDKVKLHLSIKNHLLQFIDPETITKIETVVQKTEKWGYTLTDSAYVGLVVHIALAVQRLKKGEVITIAQEGFKNIKDMPEYQAASQMAQELESELDISIPESEIGYITMHLLGAKFKRLHASPLYTNEVDEYVDQMIQIVESEIGVSLAGDAILIEHLSTHLGPAIHRMKLNMEFRNPLLDNIKEKYPHIFAAASKAAVYLEKELHCPVPEEEIGYIAMHFGAAAVRNEELQHSSYRVLLVCTSGIGTSHLLSAQIERQFSYINVVDIVSLLHLNEWLRNNPSIDVIISTVPFECEEQPVVVVNPFLLPQDIQLIKGHLKQVKNLKKGEKEIVRKNIEIEDKVQKINRYGEAMEQLLNHTFIANDSNALSKEEVIKQVAEYVQSQFNEINSSALAEELRKREEIGALVMEEEQLAMLHCRSPLINQLCICLFKLKKAVDWEHGMNVHTVLALLAPKNAPKEHIAIISEVSKALMEEDFVQSLTGKDSEEARNQIKSVLGKGYLAKSNALLSG